MIIQIIIVLSQSQVISIWQIIPVWKLIIIIRGSANNGQPIFDGTAHYLPHVGDDDVNYIINDFGDGTGEIVPLDANDDNPDYNNKIPITSSFDMSNYTGMQTGNYYTRAS